VWALQPPPQEDPSFEIPSFPDSAVSWLNANAGFGNHNLKGSYQFHADGVVEVDGLPTRGERASDFVINLNVSSDPAEQGVSLELGDEVRVTLPDGFVFDEDALEEFPICSLGKPCPSTLIADACLPGTLACSTVVFLQGYPQSAIPPDVSRDGNTLVLTPRAAIGPVVKNIHIIGKAIVNPGPGKYSVPVRHTDSGGNVLWKGSGKVRILPRIRRSINITSVFASLVGGGPPFANTIYQTVVSGETEFPWNFLLWDHKGEPYSDIELLQETENHYLLLRDGDTIGHARIDAPEGATGFSINNTLDVTLPGTPVIGLGPGGVPPPPVQRYEVQFDAGFAPVPGRYTTTLRLNNGNQVEMFVDVVE
jgi:hypothetical protein